MPESMPTNWLFGCTMIFLGVVVLMEFNVFSGITRKHTRENLLRGLMNRVAKFHCPDCRRPICLLGASHASIHRVSRQSSEWKVIDKSNLTPRQKITAEPVWIAVRCMHCDQELCFDEIGVPTTPPEVVPANSGDFVAEQPSLTAGA